MINKGNYVFAVVTVAFQILLCWVLLFNQLGQGGGGGSGMQKEVSRRLKAISDGAFRSSSDLLLQVLHTQQTTWLKTPQN